MYLTKALRNEENRTLRARNTICHWCGAVVSDAMLLKGRWGREVAGSGLIMWGGILFLQLKEKYLL